MTVYDWGALAMLAMVLALGLARLARGDPRWQVLQAAAPPAIGWVIAGCAARYGHVVFGAMIAAATVVHVLCVLWPGKARTGTALGEPDR